VFAVSQKVVTSSVAVVNDWSNFWVKYFDPFQIPLYLQKLLKISLFNGINSAWLGSYGHYAWGLPSD